MSRERGKGGREGKKMNSHRFSLKILINCRGGEWKGGWCYKKTNTKKTTNQKKNGAWMGGTIA